MNALTGRKVLAAVSTLVVVSAVVAAILKLGSPADQRVRRLDQRRVDDLSAISRAVDLYWTRQAATPATLDDLASTQVLFISGRDPETGRPYAYRPIAVKRYELCAEFKQAAAPQSGMGPSDFWTHGAGRQCFQLEAHDLKTGGRGY